jgi:hypothetical protein
MRLFSDYVKRLANMYNNALLSPKASGVVWTSKDGRKTTIADMEATHAKHIVAMVQRELEQGKCAYLDKDGKIAFALLMTQLVDDKLAMIDDEGNLRISK